MTTSSSSPVEVASAPATPSPSLTPPLNPKPLVAVPTTEMATRAKADEHTLIIEAGREEAQYWRDLWRGRELLGFMVWRDIVVRYKQTVIGLAWSILRPLLTMVVGLFIFQRVLHTPTVPGVPFALTLYAAILPWQFFSDALSSISASLLANANVLTKIYFPRLMIPLSKLAVALVDLIFSAAVLALILAWFRFVPSIHIVFLPLFLLLACLSALGTGLWSAALNVKYRDFMYIIPVVLQFGIYASSVFLPTQFVYDSTRIPDWAKFAYSLNPMVSVVDGFRWCLLGDGTPMHWPALACSCVLVLFILITGHRYFRKTESTFADVI